MPQTRLNRERLESLIFFFEQIKEGNRSLSDVARDMKDLQRLGFQMDSLCSPTKNDAVKCLEALTKGSPDPAMVVQTAEVLEHHFKSLWKHTHYRQLAASREIEDLFSVIKEGTEGSQRTEEPVRGELEEIAIMLDKLREGRNSALSNEGGTAEFFDDLLQGLEIAERTAVHSDLSMDQVGIKEKISQFKTHLLYELGVAPQGSKNGLEKLLRDLRPYAGDRKCRPFELFLFAAQEGLLKDKLVRLRSSLTPGLAIGRPYRSALSILEGHKGANLL